MSEINILHDPIMEFTVFLTVLISNFRDEEFFHFFHVPILTENVYWKLLKYKLTVLILTQNMQAFMELWYETLICVTRVAMWATCCWELDPIILKPLVTECKSLTTKLHAIFDHWPVVISSADGVQVYLLFCIDFKWINFCVDLFLWDQFSVHFTSI